MNDATIEVLVWLYTILAIFTPILALLAFCQLMAAVIGWRTDFRNKRLRRFGILAAMSLLMPVLLTGLWRGVIRPAKGNKLLARYDSQRAEILASKSLVQVGDKAPTFHSKSIDGTPVSTSSEGDVILINFFATWCGPCMVELPHIEKLWRENNKNPKFKVLAIGREESEETLVQFRDKHGFTFPICADVDDTIFPLFAKEAIPRTLIVASDGRIAYSQVGFMEEDLPKFKAVLAKKLASTKDERTYCWSEALDLRFRSESDTRAGRGMVSVRVSVHESLPRHSVDVRLL